MRIPNAFRTALFLFGVFSVLYLYPLVTLLCIVVVSIRYRAWEAPVLGLLTDLMWNAHTGGWFIPYATLIAVAVVWLAEPLRSAYLTEHW